MMNDWMAVFARHEPRHESNAKSDSELIHYCCLCVQILPFRPLYCIDSFSNNRSHNFNNPTLQYRFFATFGTIFAPVRFFYYTDECDGTFLTQNVWSESLAGNPGCSRPERDLRHVCRQPTALKLIGRDWLSQLILEQARNDETQQEEGAEGRAGR
jgi:hypothetical protein